MNFVCSCFQMKIDKVATRTGPGARGTNSASDVPPALLLSLFPVISPHIHPPVCSAIVDFCRVSWWSFSSCFTAKQHVQFSSIRAGCFGRICLLLQVLTSFQVLSEILLFCNPHFWSLSPLSPSCHCVSIL